MKSIKILVTNINEWTLVLSKPSCECKGFLFKVVINDNITMILNDERVNWIGENENVLLT